MPSCCASTRSPRSKPSTAPRRCCRCSPVRPNGERTTIGNTAPRRCLQRSTSRPAPSSPRHTAATGPSNSASSSTASTRACPPTSTCTSSWTTTRLTRHRSSGPGSPNGRGSTSISPRPYASWLNLIERWFAESDDQATPTQRAPAASARSKAATHEFIAVAQCQLRPLRLDQDRRRDPGEHRSLRSAHPQPHTGTRTYVTNHWDRTLGARGETPAAFDRRCIPPRLVAPRSHAARMLPRRAARAGRLPGLGATRAFTTDS